MIAGLKKIYLFYILIIVSLFLYSFTQIDLSLTFSRIDFLRSIVSSFQQIGYFNRPFSTYIYLGIVISLFGFYFYFLKLAFQKRISLKFIWKIILATSVVLIFSYNAFSYDIFNYIFDAKIFTHYNLNPYLHKALDFPADPMLSFMRWTHRTYPYGPFWLILTIPISYIGLNLFIPTFYLFKMLIMLGFLGSLWILGEILKKIAPNKEALGLVFFGLNPLILIESLVSPHLDIVMMFFALMALWQLINKKYTWAFILLFLSIEIKFATLFLLPVFLYIAYLQKNKKNVPWESIFLASVVLMSIAVLITSIYSGNFQPWYMFLPLTFMAFVGYKYYVFIPGFILSFFAILTYAPYLYFGNWDNPVPQILNHLYFYGFIISAISLLIFRTKILNKHEK